jgi:hypothetical protein
MLRRSVPPTVLVLPGVRYQGSKHYGGMNPNNPWMPDKLGTPSTKARGVEGEKQEVMPSSWPSYKTDAEIPNYVKRDEWPKEWDDPSKAIQDATGPDNKPGVYSTNPVPRGSKKEEQGSWAVRDRIKGEPKAGDTHAKWRADNINYPEFKTAFGEFERRRFGAPGIDKDYKRQYPLETVDHLDLHGHHPAADHHPEFDYTSKTGKREGIDGNTNAVHWDLKRAVKSLYKASLVGLPLVKQYYWVQPDLKTMAKRVKNRFYMNQHVRDTDAIRSLLFLGWTDYTEMITFRKQKAGILKFFSQNDVVDAQISEYTKEEGKLIEERRWWEGEEQKREGPYNGFWSLAGQQNYEEFQKLKGRIPMGWHAGKGYFEAWRCDGTNCWEKNMDYEGWYLKNVDPDRASARKEIQNWVCSAYQQPKHYASKNRRSYRRFVKDLETIMNTPSQELYATCRETAFQQMIREEHPETNRLHAEKKLARHDDEVFTFKFDEYDKCLKQVMREFPSPRYWKTDTFWFRFKYLYSPWYEYNWAKAPIGARQEREFNDWVSSTANYVVLNSPQFLEIKEDKKRNPMAHTWGDFYSNFDPDKPETRKLPWYHPEFDYDRRHFWDEKCMRMKKWVASGDVDTKHGFFEAMVYEWEQYVNRPEIMKQGGYAFRKHNAPRMVQLYRALIRRNDIALTNQMVAALEAKHGAKKIAAASQAELTDLVAKHDWSSFRFQVPVVIYPDGATQPQLTLDGVPVKESVKVEA